MGAVTIQLLGVDDQATLAAAVRGLLYTAPAGETDLASALASNNSYFIVALLDSTPIGYLSAYRFPAVDRSGFHVYLYDIVVHDHHRRRGIASRMIETLKANCLEDDVFRVWAGTSLDNEAAMRTFESTGATRESETYAEFIYHLSDEPS